MTRQDVFEADRKETDYYFNAHETDEVWLPVTRLGFDALLVAAAKICVLPIDDEARKLLCGFIHSLDRKTNTTTIKTVAAALHKSYANQLTWTIDQEIDAKLRESAKAAQPELKVVPPETEQANH